MKSDISTLSPEFQKLSSPIIIIGMHRSGTSMLAGILHILGVYVDPGFPNIQGNYLLERPSDQIRQNGYGEATCFRLLNEEIMAQAGADWFYIEPFLRQRDEATFKQKSLNKMRRATHTKLKREFLDQMPTNFQGQWGWKDPRNSLTLPYWLELFPNAKILHVRRSYENIVESLIRRSKAVTKEANTTPKSSSIERLQNLYRNPQDIPLAIGNRLGLLKTPKTSPNQLLQVEDCFALAEEYENACLRYRSSTNIYTEVWYENMIANPENQILKVIDTFDLTPSEIQLQYAKQFVSRALPNQDSKIETRDLVCF